jgi:hypothetical protein
MNPLAENPPIGAMIDFYLKANATGSVIIEILDPSGQMIRRYSSEDKPNPVDPNRLNYPPFWARTTEPLPATAGMHRFIWDLRPTPPLRPAGGGGGGGGFFRGGAQPVLPGVYTVKLTVGSKSYMQPLTVKMDPRVK